MYRHHHVRVISSTHLQDRQDLMFIPFDNDPYPLEKQACLYLVFMCTLALSLSRARALSLPYNLLPAESDFQ